MIIPGKISGIRKILLTTSVACGILTSITSPIISYPTGRKMAATLDERTIEALEQTWLNVAEDYVAASPNGTVPMESARDAAADSLSHQQFPEEHDHFWAQTWEEREELLARAIITSYC